MTTIDTVYDNFESNQAGLKRRLDKCVETLQSANDNSCDGCIHKPKNDTDTYDEVCGSCSRFYGDYWESE